MLKLLLRVSETEPGSEAETVDAVYLELDEDYAADLLNRRRLARAVSTIEGFYAVEFFDYGVLFVKCYHRLSEAQRKQFSDGSEKGGGIIRLPDRWRRPAGVRVAIPTIKLMKDGVAYSASERHGGTLVESVVLPWKSIECGVELPVPPKKKGPRGPNKLKAAFKRTSPGGEARPKLG